MQSGSIRHLFRLKRACKTETNLKVSLLFPIMRTTAEVFQLSRLFHVSADYILNGDSPDNLDPIVNEAIEILNHLKTEKAKQSALAMLRQIQILEG